MEERQMSKDNLQYEADESFRGITIDEGKNGSYLGIRKIRWNPDKPFKIDLRRYVVRTDGDEFPSKGISLDDDVADKVTESMIELGYGDTGNIITIITDREDFAEAVQDIIEADEITSSAREMLDSLLKDDNHEDD